MVYFPKEVFTNIMGYCDDRIETITKKNNKLNHTKINAMCKDFYLDYIKDRYYLHKNWEASFIKNDIDQDEEFLEYIDIIHYDIGYHNRSLLDFYSYMDLYMPRKSRDVYNIDTCRFESRKALDIILDNPRSRYNLQ